MSLLRVNLKIIFHRSKLQLKNKAVAQQWMPVMDINNELLHLKNGSIVGFIKVQPLNMDLLSKKEQRRKIKSLTEVYNG